MNKLLTTITLLCFSVAANADIYFCDPSMGGAISPSNMRASTDYETTSFIIDTDKGFREVTQETVSQDYVGNCFDEILQIRCSVRNGGGHLVSLQMSLKDEIYSFSYTMPVLGAGFPFLIAMVGTCTKA